MISRVHAPNPLRLFSLFAFACGTIPIPIIGCHSNSSHAGAIPTATSSSTALPASNTAADAPNAPQISVSRTDITSYSDPANGVSFKYPSSWRPLTPADNIFQPEFTQYAGAAKIVEAFRPKGTPYASTNLVGMTFSYTVKAGMTESACRGIPSSINQNRTPTQTETINGITYTRAEGSDAAMCHQMSFIANAAKVGASCYVFERDLETECPGVRGDGQGSELTPEQRSALQKQLDETMASVQIAHP